MYAFVKKANSFLVKNLTILLAFVIIFSAAKKPKVLLWPMSLHRPCHRPCCAKTLTFCYISSIIEHNNLETRNIYSLSKEQPVQSREITRNAFLSELCPIFRLGPFNHYQALNCWEMACGALAYKKHWIFLFFPNSFLLLQRHILSFELH